MAEKLMFFISGKEGELENERVIAIQTIKNMGFNCTSSEDRPASSKPIIHRFRREIEKSDIYIGIFGVCDSKPTRQEFDLARENGKEVLVFVKNSKDEMQREPDLQVFLEQIKEPESGVIIDSFDNVIDLKDKIIHAISGSLSEEFWNSKDVEHKLKQKDTSIKLVNFKLPEKIKLGEKVSVTAEIKGSIKNGFLDLMLQTTDQRPLWFPDPKSYDSPSGIGRLDMINDNYKKTWQFTIPTEKKSGKYLARMLVIEDKITSSKKFRNNLDYRDREVIVE